MNSQSLRWATISGLSHRLCYTEDGVYNIKNIPGWSVIYEYKHTPINPDKAYFFYETIGFTGKTKKHVDIFDREFVTYYQSSEEYTAPENVTLADKPNLTATYIQVGEPQPHNFEEVPVIPILNNDLWMSDFEKSQELMDVYDEIISDT